MTIIPFLKKNFFPLWCNEPSHALTVDDLQHMDLDQLLEICNTDPAHVNTNSTGDSILDKAFKLLKDAEHLEWLDFQLTREGDYPR